MKTKTWIVLCVVALSLGQATISRADEDNSVAATTDAVIVRPACFLATIVGSAIFVVALPVAVCSGSVKQTANTLVMTPAKATFTRPIGDFSNLNN